MAPMISLKLYPKYHIFINKTNNMPYSYYLKLSILLETTYKFEVILTKPPTFISI